MINSKILIMIIILMNIFKKYNNIIKQMNVVYVMNHLIKLNIIILNIKVKKYKKEVN